MHNYLSEDPFKNFVGGHVFTNQKGKIVTFSKFWNKYIDKFSDKNLKDPKDAINIIYQEKIPSEIFDDIQEP